MKQYAIKFGSMYLNDITLDIEYPISNFIKSMYFTANEDRIHLFDSEDYANAVVKKLEEATDSKYENKFIVVEIAKIEEENKENEIF